jgi:hypothetical protein
LPATSDKGLISRIYRELKKVSPQKNKTPKEKWVHKLNREFSKGSGSSGQ